MTTLICCQPATLYYAWQIEVMLNSFIKQGINLNFVDIVCSLNPDSKPELWEKLANNYPARFFFYKDDRPDPKYYISSVRPWILAKHFAQHPYLSERTIFYHDCDIALTRPIDFNRLEQTSVCYGSDTRFYIGHDYIKSKGDDVLDEMCKIVGIDKSIVKINELNSIGAQYILKGVNQEFWLKVYNDSERLFRNITNMSAIKNKVFDESERIKKQSNPDYEIIKYHSLQIWCADMWALLWNLWKEEKVTRVSKELDFSWATSTESDWINNAIFHNAGVEDDTTGLFYKGKYQNSLPYNLNLEIQPGTASKNYYELIQETEKKSVLI